MITWPRGSQPGVILPCQEPLAIYEDISVVTTLGEVATSTWWVEARNAAEHLSVHQKPPLTRIIQPQSVNSDEFENPDLATT